MVKKTELHITAMDFQDGNLMLGCENTSEDVMDAIVSLLNKRLIVEHDGRSIKSISLNLQSKKNV